jgi:hypothetical protein
MARLGVVRFSLSSPDTLHHSSFFVSLSLDRLACEARASSQRRESFPRRSARLHLTLHTETIGSPTFPGSPRACLPWSQTPVVSCTLALAHPGLLPSSACMPVGFHALAPCEALLVTTTLHISGLNTAPASLIRPASDSRYRVYPRTSLLACWRDCSQVRLGPCRPSPTGEHYRISWAFAQSHRPGFNLARAPPG